VSPFAVHLTTANGGLVMPNLVGIAIVGALCCLLIPTVTLALFGYLLLVAPVRDNPALRVRRLFVYWLSVGGFFAGGAIWILETVGEADVGIEWPYAVAPFPVNPLTGLVGGAILGNLVERIVWLRLKSAEEVGS
jgi:hypothetical protein